MSIQTRSKKTLAVPELFLHGQGLEPSIMSFSGESSVIVQVILKPHALYSIFGIPGVNLVLGHLPTEEFQGLGLLSSLRAGETDRDLFDAVYGFLEERRAASGLRDPKVEEALSFLFPDPCSFSTETIAAKLHLSPRQLQRRFLKVVGCPLKSFLRLRRANLALALLQKEEYDQLSDIAYALNYADQSHFIRDMKEFTWVAPSQLEGVFEDHSREGIGFSYL